MTVQEVCQELRKGCKMHLHALPLVNKKGIESKMTAPYFSLTLRNIESGFSKQETIKSFFGRFGYYGGFNEWSKDYNGNTVTLPNKDI